MHAAYMQGASLGHLVAAEVAELRIHLAGAAAIRAHAPTRRLGDRHGWGHHWVSGSRRYHVAQLNIGQNQEDASDDKGEEEALLRMSGPHSTLG